MPVATTPPTLIGINGFGRIGRTAFRASLARTDCQVVAINHTAPSLEQLVHVITYDTTHGRLVHPDLIRISDDRQALLVGDRRIILFSTRNPAEIDWASAGAEYVVESTGKMTTMETARVHIDKGGAKRVIISAPSKDAKTFVFGVNHREYNGSPSMEVVSNASCTTNCLAPIAAILDREFGIENACMSTIHASTSSQPVLDGYSKKDWRSGRGVGGNIIPTTTGAAKAIKLVLPRLAGKFNGVSIRVPITNVSMVDLTVYLSSPVASVDALLEPFRHQGSVDPISKHVLEVTDLELVSSDFIGSRASSIIDAKTCSVLGTHVAKIVAWYDNERGYSERILDLASHMHSVDLALEQI